jgi:hypothetical protein
MALPRFNASLSAVTSEVAPAMRSKTGDEHIKKPNLSTITYKCQLQSNLWLQPPEDTSQGMMGWLHVESQSLQPRVGVKIRDRRQKLFSSVSNFYKKQRTATCQLSDLVTRSSNDREYGLTTWASASSQCKLIVSSLPSSRHDRSY